MNSEEKREYRSVLKRDNRCCIICGNPIIEVHHVITRRNGITHRKNMVCLCKNHHQAYHARGKEGKEELLNYLRGIYGAIEEKDLHKKGKYSNFAIPN